MHAIRKLAGMAVILAIGASPLRAQEQGRVAIDLGYPPAFAVLWRIADRLALRPELSFLNASNGGTAVWTITSGGSALVSIRPTGALTPYAGARLVGSWTKDGTGVEQWVASGLFGARYAIERHFGISAETGLAYTKLRFRLGPGGTFIPSDVWNLAPAGRVSALLYF